MNPLIIGQFALADPNANPIELNDLIKLLNQLISINMQGAYIPYVIGHDAPGVNDQDKAWIELDTAGRPIATKVWYAGNPGAWRRIYNGMIGEIRGYSGNPNDDFTVNPTSGAFGAGKIGEQYDGWYLCNGVNGTPNLSDKFLLGGHMDKSDSHPAYDNGWLSSVPRPDGVTDDLKTGGQFTISLTENNVPLLTNHEQGQAKGLWIHGNDNLPSPSGHGSSSPLVSVTFADNVPRNWNLTKDNPYGKDPVDPTWTTPPFVSLGWIIFRGY